MDVNPDRGGIVVCHAKGVSIVLPEKTTKGCTSRGFIAFAVITPDYTIHRSTSISLIPRPSFFENL